MNEEKKKELISLINGTLCDYKFNREYSEELRGLYTKLNSKLVREDKSYKQAVLDLFLENMLESFETCLLLIDNKRYKDAYVVGRRLIEILIREYYLAKNDLYEFYYRLKYKEYAETFRRLLVGNKIETIAKTHWWAEREEIVNDNINFYDWAEKHNNKKYDMPNIENMAKDSGLTYLYKVRYGAWSKYVHCNMILEKDTSTESLINISFLRDINACMFEFIKKYSQELDIFKEEIQDFKYKNPTLTSFDTTTGQLNSQVEITIEYFKALFKVDIEKEEEDKQYETTLFNNNEKDYLRNKKDLKELIKEKESELANILEDK